MRSLEKEYDFLADAYNPDRSTPVSNKSAYSVAKEINLHRISIDYQNVSERKVHWLTNWYKYKMKMYINTAVSGIFDHHVSVPLLSRWVDM